MTTQYKIEPIANYHCVCGEGPVWDERERALYWTDIPAGEIYRYDAATGRHGRFYRGEPLGGFTLQEGGSMLLFGADRIRRLAPGGAETVIVEGIDADMKRFNDVIADPAGRVFAGTIGQTRESGGLYRLDLDGTVTCLFKGTGCANGMGFSPDRRAFYWTDTTNRKIFRFRYDQATGGLSGREVLVDLAAAGVNPDGLTVDAAGDIWSAEWGGWGVARYSPAGEPLGRIELPVEKVSSVAFGGADLTELYVTTAGGRAGAEAPDGTLYRARVGVPGRPEFRSRVGV